MSVMARNIVGLSGGVGGARFLDGLYRVVREQEGATLTAIVNTGDDFEHWGLSISPDLDTVMYTLGGLSHEERGWGLAEESFATLEMVKRYGGDAWFMLGDRDLATHMLRTAALREGAPLHAVTARLAGALGITARILPMTDGPRRTMIDTRADGTLTFQDWFVRRRAQPEVRRVWFDGDPPAAPGVIEAIEAADVVMIGPSNPYVSIDPITTLPGVREALAKKTVIAVSPIVHGLAVKGPLGTMIPELAGRAPTAAAVARHYGGLLAGMVVERGDEDGFAEIPGLAVLGAETVMRSGDDRARLAGEALRFAATIAR